MLTSSSYFCLPFVLSIPKMRDPSLKHLQKNQGPFLSVPCVLRDGDWLGCVCLVPHVLVDHGGCVVVTSHWPILVQEFILRPKVGAASWDLACLRAEQTEGISKDKPMCSWVKKKR